MVEIYNDFIYDLLSDKIKPANPDSVDSNPDEDDINKYLPKSKLYRNSEMKMCLENLCEKRVDNIEEIKELIKQANNGRNQVTDAIYIGNSSIS